MVCSNVLEHVADVPAFLSAAATLLKADGVLIVAVPPIVSAPLREQNLANPYHLNIWSPQQWAHVLDGYFGEVETFQHWYDKPGVELNLVNSPHETVLCEQDFYFREATPERLYDVPTLTAVFTARAARAAARWPTAPSYVDDSFSRPAAARAPQPAGWRRARHALVS
jgi:hypothetical protein